jgi:hypothetical protein
MFCNVDELLNELNLSEEEKKKIVQDVRNDFPDDEMLFELHLIRVVHHRREKSSEKLENLQEIADPEV